QPRPGPVRGGSQRKSRSRRRVRPVAAAQGVGAGAEVRPVARGRDRGRPGGGAPVTPFTLSSVALALAALPALLYLRNTRLFRPPPAVDTGVSPPSVSVLIPARNEEAAIGACVESVLASEGVGLEVIVLDDHSEDRTAEIVREMARKDSRARLETAPPLP